MNVSSLYLALGLALAGTPLLVATEASAQTARQVRSTAESTMVVTGTIGITPEGGVQSLAITQQAKLAPSVFAFIDETVRSWRFKPVEVDGKAVAATAPIRVRLQGRTLPDGQVEIAIRDANFSEYNPRATDSVTSLTQSPPSYPEKVYRMGGQGEVLLLIQVDREGKVADLVAEQVNMSVVGSEPEMAFMRKQMANASIAAARRWTFRTPTTGAAKDDASWTIRVPVSFSLPGKGRSREDRFGQWRAYIPGPKQSAPWRKDDGRAGSDLLPEGGVYMADGAPKGLELLTPLAKG